MKKHILILLLLIPIVLFSQRRNRYRYEVIYSGGVANYLGELGGADQVGTNLLKDLELPASRPVLGIALRYKNSPFFAVKSTFSYATIYGNDNLTKDPYRNNRNLHFRSTILEFGMQAEGYFTKEQPGHLYRIRNARGMRRSDIQGYGFAGVAVFFYNPMAEYKGTWYSLRRLGTEGQGLDPAKKQYSRFSVAIPMGLGTKYKINRRWSVGLEVGMRKTFTDYLDDVSTEYYNNDEIKKAKGEAAAKFADPSLQVYPWSTLEGLQRGDPSDKDTYMFATFNASYKFYRRKRTRSKF